MIDEELEKLFEGFPIQKRERDMLNQVAEGTAVKSSGAGGATLTNLITRKWIVRTERVENYGLTLYAITSEGQLAINIDERAIKSGLRRPAIGARAPAAVSFHNLLERWKRLTEILK